jgi:hypothetical protein
MKQKRRCTSPRERRALLALYPLGWPDPAPSWLIWPGVPDAASPSPLLVEAAPVSPAAPGTRVTIFIVNPRRAGIGWFPCVTSINAAPVRRAPPRSSGRMRATAAGQFAGAFTRLPARSPGPGAAVRARAAGRSACTPACFARRGNSCRFAEARFTRPAPTNQQQPHINARRIPARLT